MRHVLMPGLEGLGGPFPQVEWRQELAEMKLWCVPGEAPRGAVAWPPEVECPLPRSASGIGFDLAAAVWLAETRV